MKDFIEPYATPCPRCGGQQGGKPELDVLNIVDDYQEGISRFYAYCKACDHHWYTPEEFEREEKGMTTYRVLVISYCRDAVKVENDRYYSVSGDIVDAFNDAVRLVSYKWNRDEFFSVKFDPYYGFANGGLAEELGYVILFENNPWFNEENIEDAMSSTLRGPRIRSPTGFTNVQVQT